MRCASRKLHSELCSFSTQTGTFCHQALIHIIPKITKLGWLDVLKNQLIFRDIIVDVKKPLKGTVDHCETGMILSELTQEMDLGDYSGPSAKHCERAASFCDTSLKDVLVLLCSFGGALGKTLNPSGPTAANLATFEACTELS